VRHRSRRAPAATQQGRRAVGGTADRDRSELVVPGRHARVYQLCRGIGGEAESRASKAEAGDEGAAATCISKKVYCQVSNMFVVLLNSLAAALSVHG
jgi:hypothetical protein